MTRESARTRAIVVTCLFFGWEWLLLELLRIPYRPPYDMTTLLGTEKRFVECVMGICAVLWGIMVLNLGTAGLFTRADSYRFAGLVAFLSTIVGLLAAFPMWTVTPWDLVWYW